MIRLTGCFSFALSSALSVWNALLDAVLWWFRLAVVELPLVLQVAIEISLFCFLGFLALEQLGVRIAGKKAMSRVAVRTLAKHYLVTTVLLFSCLIVGYLRTVRWFTELRCNYLTRPRRSDRFSRFLCIIRSNLSVISSVKR